MENKLSTNQINKNKSGRNYGIDLLRCFAMIMIVMLHTLSRSGLLTETEVASFKYEVVWFIEIFCYCAVDCFVIISGYVGLRSKFRISRILLLWLQVVFYNAVLTVVIQGISGELNAVSVLRAFLPVSTDAYWFFTQYFALCFFMPLINKLVMTIKVRQSAFFLGAMLVLFSVMPMIYAIPVDILGEFNEKLFFTERGYSVLWMIVMYFMGALLKRFVDEGGLSRVKAPVYAVVVLISDIIILAIQYVCVSGDEVYSHYFVVSYTSPFVVAAAAGLVMLFSKFKFSPRIGKAISAVSAGAFSVYLIHSQNDVYPLFKTLVEQMLDYRVLKLLPCLLFTVVFVFIVGIVADFVRQLLFKALGINKLCKKSDKLFKSVSDGEI